MVMDSKMVAIESVAVSATSVFSKLHEEASVTSGFSRSSPGSIVIDCNISGIRIALITIAPRPDEVCLVVGPKGSDDLLEEIVIPTSELTANIILNYMDKHFAKTAIQNEA